MNEKYKYYVLIMLIFFLFFQYILNCTKNPNKSILIIENIIGMHIL